MTIRIGKKPSLGDIVYVVYWLDGKPTEDVIPAIVTHVWNGDGGEVDVTLFPRGEQPRPLVPVIANIARWKTDFTGTAWCWPYQLKARSK